MMGTSGRDKLDPQEAKRKARRLARRAAEEPDVDVAGLRRKVKRLVGRAGQRRLWRRYDLPD